MTWRVLLLVGLAVGVASSSHAQAFGACETGTAQRFVENSVLRFSVFNTGGLFFGGSTTSGDGYLIPKQNGTSPIFAAGLWLGGRVDGELRVAAARYGSWDFWPGPLEDAADPPTDCSTHDRIYVVSRDDIRRYYQTGELTDDLRDWPHQLGAPVLDGDGDSTNYDLRAGDQPDLIGDTAAWWVMNDAGNDHGISGPNGPLGVEVRAQAFVYGETGTPFSPALDQTTFIRYEIENRGDRLVDSMYATFYTDPDLGDAGDDFVGSDTLRNLLFVYNATNMDGTYGVAPPAQGFQVLQGPVGLANGRDDDFDGVVDEPGERLGATSIAPFNLDPFAGQDPSADEHFDVYMRGTWGREPYRAYGNGYYTSGAPTRFFFTGDPVTGQFWSEVNVDSMGTPNWAGDRRAVISSGPFRLTPGASTTILYALPHAQGTSNLNSVSVLRGYASMLQALAENRFYRGRLVEASRLDSSFELALSQPRPNPSRQPEVLLTLPEETHVRATVYDALGRQLELVVDRRLPEGETVLTMPGGLAPGTYVLRVRVEPGGEEALSFTVVR
ncbi:MAG: hypothetical protein Rubg2KO_33890 [Rubricoccaceae bacterium]